MAADAVVGNLQNTNSQKTINSPSNFFKMNLSYLQRLVLLHLSLPEPVVLQRRLVAGDGVDAPGGKC